MAIEAIVRQKDKETTAANIAKLAGKVLSFFKKQVLEGNFKSYLIFFSQKKNSVDQYLQLT